MNFHDFLKDSPSLKNLLASLALVILIAIARSLIVRVIRKSSIEPAEMRLRIMLQIRNLSYWLMAIGLITIWSDELRTLALSLIAVLVAVVIATKELILCFTGSIIRTGARSFSVGDRIEVAGIRGDVIDVTLLSTIVLEVGPGTTIHQYTGRAVTIPNSIFASSPVMNESFTEEFVLHSFNVMLGKEQDWKEAERVILNAANVVCEPFLNDARAHFSRIVSRHAFVAPVVEPRVTISLAQADKIELVVRIPAPARLRARLEQEIVRQYLETGYRRAS